MKRSVYTALLIVSGIVQGSDTSLTTALTADMANVALRATQSNQNIDYQPFILSVWERTELMAFGVRSLKDALLLVPGIEMTGDTINNRTPIIRGSNPFAYGQTKLLIDGVIMNDQSFDTYNAYLDFPVELIKRIEVVRGSGSFIEGVNGYSGTINVVTHAENTGLSSGAAFARTGSDSDLMGGLRNMYKMGSGSLYVDAFAQKNDTQSPVSVTDRFSKTGYAPLKQRQFGAGFNYTLDDLYVKGRFNGYTQGSAFGNLYALPNPGGEQQTPSWMVEGGYRYAISNDLTLRLKAGIADDSWKSSSRSFPEDTPIPVGKAPNGSTVYYSYPQGYWAYLQLKNRRLYGGISALYTGIEGHTLKAGYTYKKEWAYDLCSITTERINGGTTLIDYTDTAPFLNADSAKRLSHEYYLSDTIDLNPSTALALSVGGVNTSDIGSTQYARGALVYQPNRSHIFKLMVGNSYRLPSWQELYTANNPSRIGNSGLAPEKVLSYETQYLYKPSVDMTASVNLFHLRNRDQIAIDSAFTFQNLGKRNITGLETEIRGNYNDAMLYAFSYSYLEGETLKGNNTIDYLTHASTQIAKGSVAFPLTSQLRAGVTGRYENAKKRSPDDPRGGSIDPYSSIDLNLLWDNGQGVYIQGIVKNIGDHIYRYPSVARTYSEDLPVEGRTFYVRAGWMF